jgi:hypothetical protein
MGQSSHSAEFVNTQDLTESGADTICKPAENSPAKHALVQTTIEDFYREGMGVAGKE